MAVVEKAFTPAALHEEIQREDGGYCPFCACPLDPGESICPDCLLDVALKAALEG